MKVSLPSIASTLAIVGASLTMLTACSAPTEAPDATPDSSSSTPVTSAESTLYDEGLPPETSVEPAGDRYSWDSCPYLDDVWVEQTNGQRITGIAQDPRFTTPACVYWSYPEEPQLSVLVRHMPSAQDAKAVVDHYAPVEITNPADLPGGWMGGRAGQGVVPDQAGALFAVAKDEHAVVVITNQEQSVKAETVAQEVINNLGL